MIVLDTSVLSLAFRRRRQVGHEPAPAIVLRQMIVDDWPLAVPGIVLQELLSGVRTSRQFHTLREQLQGLPVLLPDENQHLRAARITNACRGAGVSCSTVDALIAAQTIAAGGQLFTTDRGFEAVAPHCGLQLFPIDGEVR